jgi:hypothetical protein
VDFPAPKPRLAEATLVAHTLLALQHLPSPVIAFNDMTRRFEFNARVYALAGSVALRRVIRQLCACATNKHFVLQWLQHAATGRCSQALARCVHTSAIDPLDACVAAAALKKPSSLLALRAHLDPCMSTLRCVTHVLRRCGRRAPIASHTVLSVCHAEFMTAALLNNEHTARVALRLFCAAFRPYLAMLHAWLADGALLLHDDPAHEFMISCDAAIQWHEPTFWSHAFALRTGCVPTFLRGAIAERILLAGKSVALLRRFKQTERFLSVRSRVASLASEFDCRMRTLWKHDHPSVVVATTTTKPALTAEQKEKEPTRVS